jgi:type IVB pilus formation R64 PilN family outer membrane protein
MINKLRRGVLLLAALALLSSCANIKQTDKDAQVGIDNAEKADALAAQPLPAQQVGKTTAPDTTVVATQAYVDPHGFPLPSKWEHPGIVMSSTQPLGIGDVANYISQITNLPVMLAPDVYLSTTSGGQSGQGQSPAGQVNSALGGQQSGSQAQGAAMLVNYAGPLSGLLDEVGTRFDVSWKYENGSVDIFRNVTHTWTVSALPAALSLSSVVGSSNALQASSSGGGGTSGGSTSSGGSLQGTSTQNASSTISLAIWQDIIANLQQIVAGTGTVTATQSTGTVTISAPPSVIGTAQEWIAEQNKRLEKMVAVNVQVLSVTDVTSDNDELNLNTVFAALSHSGAYALNIGNAGAQTASSAASSLSTSTPGLAFGVLSPTSGVSGSSAVATALSTLGKVNTVYNTAVSTLNGIPAPLQVSNTQGYLQSITTTDTGGTTNAVQTELTPGTVTTGYSMVVLPRVDNDDNQILLQFSIAISALAGSNGGFTTYTSNGESIQLPDVNSQDFVQQANVPSGSTLVLTGYNQLQDSSTYTGSGSPFNFFLGGGVQASRSKAIIVILLTPVVLDNPTTIQDASL